MPTTTADARPPLPRRRRGAEARWIRAGLIFASAALLVTALAGDRGLAGVRRAEGEARRIQAAIDAVRAENAGLREQARRLREDPAAVEELARRDLGLIGPGEILVVVKDVR